MIEFIRIEHTIEAAKFYRYSPIENPDMLYINGIQLLPNNPLPYVQRTNNPEGIEIEDFVVSVVDLCGNELADITDAFDIVTVFQDENGKPQVEWSLTNIDYDAGMPTALNEYALADATYNEWVAKLQNDKQSIITPTLLQNILAFYNKPEVQNLAINHPDEKQVIPTPVFLGALK